MKKFFATLCVAAVQFIGNPVFSQTINADSNKLYIDVHQVEGGKVKFADVAAAHAKDVAVQGKYGVKFLKYWVDESHGMIYCLSSTSDTNAIYKAHKEAHGLLPKQVLQVKDGPEALIGGKTDMYIDIHSLGAGNVTAKDVEAAHKKDVAVQGKYGVNFINYWVDEKKGIILCLSEAANADSIVHAHKEAHGLVPVSVSKVKQGQ